MLLKSLRVKDFRQFIGEQSIDFATDADKNVTMVMGEMGSGKTALAQIFTWCLYGETSFEDKILLCKRTAATMLANAEETVRAVLTLEHNGIEYTITSEQKYRKDEYGAIKSIGQRAFAIFFKRQDGVSEPVRPLETEIRMKEILPRELAKYFFFDGKRIDNMRKEIRHSRSRDFAEAVQNLLGLSAYTSALSHLGGRGKTNVIAVYNESYDSRSDSKIDRKSVV
jgi:DNA sulfur modification protein DndD